jgi:hypothetical protein
MIPADSAHALARDREEAAEQLETAIAALGAAFQHYERLTRELTDRTHEDLSVRLDAPIILHLARAGFGRFLDRKLTGTPASLRALCEQQHERLA